VNTGHLEVHDLDHEQMECQVNEVIRAGNAKYLQIPNDEQSLVRWLRQNPDYDGCKHCLAKFHRK